MATTDETSEARRSDAAAGSAAPEHDVWTGIQIAAAETAFHAVDAECERLDAEYAAVPDDMRDHIINARLRLDRLARTLGMGRVVDILSVTNAELLKTRVDVIMELCEARRP